ncbi:MAG: citrate synthase family protein [Anaerolineae bacterium]|jgi:citrate synthase|nr:citrate synthase family protein [Anaerolineae bacterium]
MKRTLSAKEAADLLQISEATLYSYVSRGLIRSEAGAAKSKTRRYLSEDVLKLRDRKEQRRNPAKVVEAALHWGSPILESALTLIDQDRLYYRGYDVAQLARDCTFEQVASLLWVDHLDPIKLDRNPDLPVDLIRLGLPALTRMQIALNLAYQTDLAAYDLAHAPQTGARILTLLTASAIGTTSLDGIAVSLAQAWQVTHPAVINTALILCADHELNASSFVARTVAGVSANPYMVVSAGLAALTGIRHGANTEKVSAFLRETGDPHHASQVIADRLRRGEGLPGFGHHLYSGIDPRAQIILSQLANYYADHPALHLAETIQSGVLNAIDKAPNLDFALATLELTLNLPRGSALILFALGRTVGWIAHAIEQYATGQMIRPRAKYIGRTPEDALQSGEQHTT